ncbi:hypothetical protein B0H14DRAFT_3484651 [Mycena olivaceomarginata]|nr:hypothetical protein B0H14DRAFT_3484651 [Mycena olivaceomarginata]
MLPVFYAQRRCAPLPVTIPLPRHRPSAYEPKSCARFARPLRPRPCPRRHARSRLALPRLRVRVPSRRHAGRSLCPRPRWRRRAYFPTFSPCVRPCPPGATHVAHPHPSRHCPLFGMPVPFRPLCAPVPPQVHTAAIPSSHALPPSSCPPPPLLASAHPPSCRHTLVLSTDGVGMNHTAVREHHIDLKALNRIIAPGDASRINAAALEAQRRPNPALQPVCGAVPAPGNLLERAARPLHPRVQVDTPDLLCAALPPADPAALATVPRGGRVLAHSGLGSMRSSAFLSVFVVVYQGGRAEAVDRVLAKQPAHRSRGTVGPASPQVACSSLSKAAITLLLNRRTITYFGRLELSLALEGHAEAAEWEEAKDPAHRLPWAPVGLGLGSGADSGVRPPRPPTTRYPTPTLFRTRRILQHIFYFFIVCPPIPTLDEHFWIDVQAPTGVLPISPCATQGDFFKEPSPITPHSIPPSPKPCAVKPNSSFEAPSPKPRHLGQGSRMDIQALAPVPPISPWRCHGEFRSSRTLDHPSPPLPRDPSWTFGCWPPCRPFHAYAPKPKFVFLSNPVQPTPPFPTVPGWTFRRWPSPCQIDLDRVTAILFLSYILVSARPPFTHGTSSQDLHPPTPHFPSVSGRTFERWQPLSPLRSEADFFL